MLDLEKEPTLTYVTNVPLSMHDMFKMKNLKAIERKLATFLEQSKFDLQTHEKENITFLTQEFRPTADELVDAGLPNLEEDIYGRRLETRIEKEMEFVDRALKF